jgi:hypothetical protein
MLKRLYALKVFCGGGMLGVRFIRALSGAFVFCFLGGCGLGVPQIGEIWDGPDGTKQLEYEIRRKIFCDLKDAAKEASGFVAITKDDKTGKVISTRSMLPDNWGAQVTLQLQVDESSALNPGVAFNTPMHAGITHFVGEGVAGSTDVVSGHAFPFLSTPQSYSLGLGGTLSSAATRIDKFNAFWSVAKLREPKLKGGMCDGAANIFIKENSNERPSSSSLLIQSDLGLKEWLAGALMTEESIYSDVMPKGGSSDKGGKSGAGSTGTFNSEEISIDIKFIIVSNGNVTPTWHLVRVSANTGNSPLFNTGRTRTHDLLITFAPKENSPLHLAGLNAQAFSSALTSTTPQPLTVPLGLTP